ncbi:iron chaperone [Rhodococcus sp. NPDC056743]|uniref:iron chaperone n=1 Tax=Rhodococcus sp. NPDC056743 TaxID=3345934 RepID=UPI00367298C7
MTTERAGSSGPAKFETIDQYIASFPAEVQTVLESVRQTIHKAVPGAGETISYQMPTITVGGKSVVHFAGWKHHISMYPLPEGDAEFEKAIDPYRSAKATAKFPLNKPIPLDLVARIAELLVARS